MSESAAANVSGMHAHAPRCRFGLLAPDQLRQHIDKAAMQKVGLVSARSPLRALLAVVLASRSSVCGREQELYVQSVKTSIPEHHKLFN